MLARVWLGCGTWALLLAGCSGGTTLAGDGSVDGDEDRTVVDDGARPDALDVPDTADVADHVEVPDASCASPYHWELQPRVIEEVMLLGVNPERLLTTDRLRLQVRMLSACERLGRVATEILSGDATDFVTVRAWAWAPVGLDCPPSAPLVPWIVEIPGRTQGNMRVVVADGHGPDGEMRLEYGREIACSGMPECMCAPGTPPGTNGFWETCRTDCSCREGLACIGSWGFAGPEWYCLHSCNDLLDCGVDQDCQEPVPDAVPWVCEGIVDQCFADDDCPTGFVCVRDVGDAPNRCEDRREPPTVRACDCDEQCPTGQWCVLALRSEPTCEIPCLRTVDCPDRGAGMWVCGTANVCVPLE